jgi:4-hydroxythreonine-4-phosphate dehydrogenase
MGDPAGVGPEIALRAWIGREAAGLPPFVLYAGPDVVTQAAWRLGADLPIASIDDPSEALAVFPRRLPILPIDVPVPPVAGQPEPANGAAVIASIRGAVDAVARGVASAVVTAPIAKSVLYAAGFNYPGHTEFLAALACEHAPGRVWQPVMMLAAEELRVVPATVHIPLADVPAALSADRLASTIRITHAALQAEFGIAEPRIAVAGLNPHAGEGGTLGTEDRDIIAPVVTRLRAEGLSVSGPLSADTMFHAAARAGYDAAVAMYHDQALIPIKTLAFERAVNITLGLPFVRTSPDHGTAFDIAGTGKADPTSFLEALRYADVLGRRRQTPA